MKSHILQWAELGAKSRFKELEAEMAQIIKQFPSLKSGRRAPAANGQAPRARHGMSASARKKIGDAQRKRWAAVKAATVSEAPAPSTRGRKSKKR